MKKNNLKIGDVVMSPQFAFEDDGSYDRYLELNNQPTKPLYAKSRWVIDETKYIPSVTHGKNDHWCSSEEYIVRELNKDGSYNPKGKTIMFTIRGIRIDGISLKLLKCVGKLHRTVNFI